MQHANEFRRCLVELDVAGIRRLWAFVSPHLPQPESDKDALISLHMARTQSSLVELKLRAYSHRWLLDTGYPSGLPDELKPKAERLYPKLVGAVGIAVRASSEFMRPVAAEVQKAMSDAVAEAYADGREDPAFVQERMFEARSRVRRKLLGIQ